MVNVKNIKILHNPYLLFSPFLLLYIVLVLIFPTHGVSGDEDKYLMFARNLVHGYYSSPSPDVNLAEGPGYPILLMPFVALGLPLIFITLLNAGFYYLSIVLLFKSLRQIVTYRKAVIAGLFWACYYNSYEAIPLILTETFTALLVSLIIYCLVKSFSPGNFKKTKKYIYLAGFFIGYLALTKVIFGYVLLLMLVGSGLLWVINKKAENYKRGVVILVTALVTTAPYLVYTYHLTGRIFYWGTSGGNNLYWMSTPYEGEYGDWFPEIRDEHYTFPGIKNAAGLQNGKEPGLQNRTNFISGANDSVRYHHQKDFEEINKYTGVFRDDAYKKIAINNIKSHPVKYAQNCISNIGRILFNYPYSYTLQKPATLLRFSINGIIVVVSLFCLFPTFINWRRLAFPVRFMLFITAVYLGGSIFGSAETRMFTAIVPVLLFWIAYIVQRSLKVNLKFTGNINP